MIKWDRKSFLTLEAQVHELQEKTIGKGSTSRKMVPSVSSEQSPGLSRRFDTTFEIDNWTFGFCSRGVNDKYGGQFQRGPASSHVEKRHNQIYWTVTSELYSNAIKL